MYEIPVEEDLELREMRPRDDLEKQLAAQIVLGTITSVDDAMRKRHEDALEYSAQALFDNERMAVAETQPLAPYIVRHLVKDRTLEIRYKAIKLHWRHVPEDDRQQFYKDIAANAIKYKDEKHEWNVRGADSILLASATDIIQSHIKVSNDEFVVKMLTLFQHESGTKCKWITGDERQLRNMPITMGMIYYDAANIRLMDLMVSDVTSRLATVAKVVKMKVGDLVNHFKTLSNGSFEDKISIRTLVYKFIAEDPSPRVRRFLIESVNHAPTLKFLAENDTDALVCRKARMRLARVNARAAYAKKYHEKKDAELRRRHLGQLP